MTAQIFLSERDGRMATENTHYGAKSIETMLLGRRSIYFIGIGGVSMSSLAELSLRAGWRVGGSDRSESALTRRLSECGIEVFYGHNAENLRGYDAVVYTVAIEPSNPEYTEAKRLGLPLVSRADYLGYVMMQKKRRLGIAGMHGKSTCTSMCAEVFMTAGVDPTVVSGASYAPMGGYYRIGRGDEFIFEACEYMDSFLDFNPTTAVILNVELEHVDWFGTLDRVCESYARFAALTGENGCVIYNSDDENVIRSLKGYQGTLVSFGIESDAEFRAVNIDLSGAFPKFDLQRKRDILCHVELSATGRHNIYNALATAAAAVLSGISPEHIAKGLHGFKGAGRRMEYRGRVNGAEIYDDYGHHPTEVAATLEGARRLAGARRLVCAFQPHTYSRTAALFDDFVKSLSKADRVLLTPIYAAREADDLDVSSVKLAAAIGESAKAVDSLEELARTLEKELDGNSMAIIMGAGNIDSIYKIIKTEETPNGK